MCKDKRPGKTEREILREVNVSAEILRALVQEVSESGYSVVELFTVEEIQGLARMISGGILTRVKNEIACAVAEKRLGLTRTHLN